MLSSNTSAANGAANYIEDVFSTWLYTGTGATQTITNGIDLAGKGGLVWMKDRTTADGHRLFNTAVGSSNWLSSNTTSGNTFETTALTSFNSNGFTLGSSSTANFNGDNYASWTFRKQPKFFDVVTYTGDGVTGRTIAHNLGSVPGCVIGKRTSATSDWVVYHRSLNGGTNPDQYQVLLNTTAAQSGPGAFLLAAAPTSTGISLASAFNSIGVTYVAYLFAHDAGGFGLTGTDNVISCGSFTTDGSGNATVNLGYEPQLVLRKQADGSDWWNLSDSMRGMSHTTTASLYPNTNGAEYAGPTLHVPTATGFNVTAITPNATYIYIAIRRGPMKVPTTGTSVYNALTRSGTGATATVTAGINPADLVISKSTDNVRNVSWWDRLRGRGNQIYSNSTAAEIFRSTSLTGFDVQNGYTVGADGDNLVINASGSTYVNWTLRRAPGFFDVVCYTGTGSATTFSHNLAAVPELMIVKARGAATNWAVYHADVGNTKYLLLNTTATPVTAASYWNNTTPTS